MYEEGAVGDLICCNGVPMTQEECCEQNGSPSGVDGEICGTATHDVAASGGTEPYYYESGDASVATVDEGGIVSAVSPGTAIIVISDANGCTGTVTVTVASDLSVTGGTICGVGETMTVGVSGGSDTTHEYESSDPSIATVDTDGVVTGVALGSVTITVTGGGCTGTADVTVVELIAANDGVICGIGEVHALEASGGGVSTYEYVSSDPSIATVDASGVVTGAAVGSVTITISGGGCTATANVRVVEAITANGGTICGVGETRALNASGGGEVTAYQYISADPAIATVDANGLVTGVATGSTAIVITGGDCMTSVDVTVEAAITADGGVICGIGETHALNALGGVADSVYGYSYTSSDSLIATVDDGGLVTGVALGSVTITISSGACEGSADVTVAASPTVSVDPATNTNVPVGVPVTFTATVTPEEGTTYIWTGITDSGASTATETFTTTGAKTVEVSYLNDYLCSANGGTSVNVIGVASVQGTGVGGSITSTTDNPGDSETVYVAKGAAGATLTLTAAPDPQGATWPANKPEWVGATAVSGNLGTAQFAIDTVSATSAGTTVEVKCGTSVKKIKVVVMDIQMTSLGFTDDQDIYLYPSFSNRIDYPDGTVPTWKKVSNPDHPVYYVKDTKPKIFGVMSVAPTGINKTFSVHAKEAGVKRVEFTALNLSTAPLLIPATAFDSAVSNSDAVRATTNTMTWEISMDGTNWQSIGTTDHRFYWGSASVASTFKVQDLGLEKACGYVNGSTDIPLAIAQGIAGELRYNPGNDNPGNPLDAYRAPLLSQGIQCSNNVWLMIDLLATLGESSGAETWVWGGVHFTERTFYRKLVAGGGYYWVSFQCDRPALPPPENVPAHPSFTFHVMLKIGGTYYDPSYGVTGKPGILVLAPADQDNVPTGNWGYRGDRDNFPLGNFPSSEDDDYNGNGVLDPHVPMSSEDKDWDGDYIKESASTLREGAISDYATAREMKYNYSEAP